MPPLLAPILSGVVAIIITLAASHFFLRLKYKSASTDSTWKNSAPLVCGLLGGFVTLGLLADTFMPDDRFFSIIQAIRILAAVTAGCLIIWSVEVIVPRPQFGLAARAAAHLVSQILASALLVWAGVRFTLMKLPGEDVILLGFMEGQVFNIAWLVIVINVIRLLDGIHGAAAVAVIIAGLTALLPNVINNEFFLTGVSLVAVGCAVGSLWCCRTRSKLPLEGSGTAILGFLFAVLTVLARQKTVTTLLLLIPLILIILVAGAAMMGMLEKRLVLPKNEKPD